MQKKVCEKINGSVVAKLATAALIRRQMSAVNIVWHLHLSCDEKQVRERELMLADLEIRLLIKNKRKRKTLER